MTVAFVKVAFLGLREDFDFECVHRNTKRWMCSYRCSYS